MSDLEKKILKDFHNFHEGKRGRLIHTEYNLKYKGSKRAQNEFAHYLMKLKEEGYLTFIDSKVILQGGMRDEEYMNSVAVIFTEYVKVTDKTKVMFEPKMDKATKVLKNESKDFANSVKNNVKSYFAKAVGGFIIFVILVLILKALELF